MDKYEALLLDIEAILATISDINKVSFGKLNALDAEDTFTAVYISPEMDNFELFKQGVGVDSYTNTFYIRLSVNMDCSTNDLLWVSIREQIINAILNDKAVWSNILDRDIVSVAHDDYKNYPRKAMAMLFEFKIRGDCII